MDKWINASSLAALKQELAAHNKTLPAKREQIGPYLEMKSELHARLILHLTVLKKAKNIKLR